jgi:hypothetical protein
VLILVIGSALRSLGVDQAALGLTFVEEARTAPRYRLFAIDDRFAALVETDEGGISVLGELAALPDELLEAVLAGEPPGVTQAPVELSDGRVVHAATGDPARLPASALDITGFGGFAAYIRSLG